MNIKATIFKAVLAGLLIIGWMSTSALAQDNTKGAADEAYKAEMKKDKTGTNPLNFTFDVRLINEYQWLNTDGDGYQDVITLDYRVPFGKNNKWQLRIKARGASLEADFNDDGIDDVNESGFGDTDIRFMTIPYLNPKNFIGAAAVGAEFFLNTATEDALGSGAFSVGPFVFLGILNPFGPGSIFAPGYQHIFSIDEEEGRSRVHRGVIDLYAIKTFGANQFWGYLDPQIVLDYENDIEFMLVEVQVGMMMDKLIGTNGHSIYILPSFGVGADRPYDVSLEVAYKVVW